MKKLCIVRGWNGQDVSIFRHGNRVKISSEDYVLEYNDLEIPGHKKLIEDITNLLTAFESYTDPDREDWDKYDTMHFVDWDGAIYQKLVQARLMTHFERKLLWGDDEWNY